MAVKVYRAKITPDNASGTPTPVGFSSGTGMFDDAGLWYEPRIIQPALFRRSISIDSLIGGGRFDSSIGELVLANADGALDYLQSYRFDGRTIVVSVGDDSASSDAAFTQVFAAKMETAVFAWDTVSIRIMDRTKELEKKPLHLVRYAGNNVLPDGTEGTSSDIKGIVKPLCFGGASSVLPVAVNTSKLIYQTAHGNMKVTSVNDGGVSLTDAGNAANIETAAAPAAGTYIWDNSGRVRVGSTPIYGLLTNVIDNVNSNLVGNIIKAIAKQGGLVDGDFVTADLTTLNAMTMSGAFFRDEIKVADALNYVCQRVGCWWGFDNAGLFRVKQLAAPSGTAVAEFTADNIASLDMESGGSIPQWKVNVNYSWKIDVRTRTEIAGSVAEANRVALMSRNLAVTVSDAATLTAHPLAEEFDYDTLLTGLAVDSDAARVLAMLKVQRSIIRASVFAEAATVAAVDIGSVVKITVPRYDMAAGKLFLVTDITTDLRRNQLELKLWG